MENQFPNFLRTGLVGLLCLLASCGKNSSFDAKPAPLPPVSREQLIRNFKLYDRFERQAPPVDPFTGKWPYGALIFASSAGGAGECSASHTVLTRVVVSAHCLRGQNFEVVFYDKDKRLAHTPVTKVLYPGDEYSRDVAVLEISLRDALRWHTVSDGPLRADLSEDPKLVDVMSFDPYGKFGFKQAFKRCQTTPLPLFRDGEGMEETLLDDKERTVNPEWQLYLDDCRDLFDLSKPKSSMMGNSGSIILDATPGSQNFGLPVASLHWLHPLSHRESLGKEIYGHFIEPRNGDPKDLNLMGWIETRLIKEDPDLKNQGKGQETSFVQVATRLSEIIQNGGNSLFVPPTIPTELGKAKVNASWE